MFAVTIFSSMNAKTFYQDKYYTTWDIYLLILFNYVSIRSRMKLLGHVIPSGLVSLH